MDLVELNNRHTDKNTVHSYLPLYETLLRPIKNTANAVLEIGCWTGGSIKLWHDYFTNASIYGCDIIDRIEIPELKESDRVFLYLDHNAYPEHYVKSKFKNIKFDFLLDDGPHSLESQKDFITFYSPLLSDNGILIIEDVQDIKWIDELKNITPENLKQYIKTYDLRKNKDQFDDIIFTIDKVIR